MTGCWYLLSLWTPAGLLSGTSPCGLSPWHSFGLPLSITAGFLEWASQESEKHPKKRESPKKLHGIFIVQSQKPHSTISSLFSWPRSSQRSTQVQEERTQTPPLGRVTKPHCKGTLGMGNIVAVPFGKYNISYTRAFEKWLEAERRMLLRNVSWKRWSLSWG